MNNQFLAALKQQTPKPVFSNSTPVDPLIATVELVINRKRIDVFFNRKPSDSILNLLRAMDFHYRPSDKAWYNKDTEENRAFLEVKFGAEFPKGGAEIVSTDTGNQASTSDTPCEASATPNEASEQPLTIEVASCAGAPLENEPPAFLTYKKQVNELMVKYNLDAPDLMVFAINFLYENGGK